MLEGLKDENGQLKKPVLFSLIGGGGLVFYLLLKGKGGVSGTSSTGQTTPLTPDLTGLQAAIDALTQSAGGGGTNPPTPKPGPLPSPTPIVHKMHKATMRDLINRLDAHQLHVYDKQGLKALLPLLDPSQLHLLHLINTGGNVANTTQSHMGLFSVAGDGGNSGGGGAGLLSIAHPVARGSGVYSGLASPYQAVSLANTPTRR